MRDSFEVRARQGSEAAIEELGKHPCPEAVRYLLDILYAVHGRSGIGMNGFAPLTYGTLADYSRLMQVPLDPEDVEALFVLDAALLYPKAEETT